MKPKLTYCHIVLCAALLCAAQLLAAESPTPTVEVPAGCAVPSSEGGLLSEQDLNQLRAKIMSHYQDWKDDASKWNKRCANRDMDAGSTEARDCSTDLASLTKQGTSYNGEAAAFKTLIGRCFELPKLQSEFESLTQQIAVDRQVLQQFGFDKSVEQIEYWGTLQERQIEEVKHKFKELLLDATLEAASEGAAVLGSLTPEQVEALNRLADAEGAPPLGIVSGARDLHRALEFLHHGKAAYDGADEAKKGQIFLAAIQFGGLVTHSPSFGLLLNADGWAAYQVYQAANAVKLVRDLTNANEGDLILLKTRSEKLKAEVTRLTAVKKKLAEWGASGDSTRLVKKGE
jgi:hypothetical protein